jgi:hypothetical protein
MHPASPESDGSYVLLGKEGYEKTLSLIVSVDLLNQHVKGVGGKTAQLIKAGDPVVKEFVGRKLRKPKSNQPIVGRLRVGQVAD